MNIPYEQYNASYLPALFSCLLATEGPVLEVGVGRWSTPLLRIYCREAGRKLCSVEEVKRLDNAALWGNCFTRDDFIGRPYDVTLPQMAQQQWSVVFLDHSPGGRRGKDAVLFHNVSDWIVVHDYSGEVEIGFQGILDRWSSFRVEHTFDPATLVLKR